tara:strand:+ start:42 stop:350 length:309 start_codon:yes stop_codon:yes gene_type:complete
MTAFDKAWGVVKMGYSQFFDEETCDACNLPLSQCAKLRGVRHPPRPGGGYYALDCDKCGEMYQSCIECDGDICYDCHKNEAGVETCVHCGAENTEAAFEAMD